MKATGIVILSITLGTGCCHTIESNGRGREEGSSNDSSPYMGKSSLNETINTNDREKESVFSKNSAYGGIFIILAFVSATILTGYCLWRRCKEDSHLLWPRNDSSRSRRQPGYSQRTYNEGSSGKVHNIDNNNDNNDNHNDDNNNNDNNNNNYDINNNNINNDNNHNVLHECV